MMNNRMAQNPFKRTVTWLATGLGLGYSPFASGTVGSVWGVAIVWGLYAGGVSQLVYIALCAVFVLLAIPICHIGEQVLMKKDDGRIVADEYLTFPICMIGLYPYIGDHGWLLPLAFCTNRFFDILKLPPAAQLEFIPGGAGITLDDVAASIYSLIANWAAFWVITTYL